jgi:hypothetical protein
MAKKKTKSTKRVATKIPVKDKKAPIGMAIIALILNVLIVPGLGSLIAGKIRIGIWQIAIAVIGFIFYPNVVGILIIMAAWIWGIVTSVKLIQKVM